MGEVNLTTEELEAMLDRAARRGARVALHELGLHDDTAGQDLNEIRSLLASWRDTKKTIWGTVIRIVTTGLLLFIGGAVWLSLKDKV